MSSDAKRPNLFRLLVAFTIPLALAAGGCAVAEYLGIPAGGVAEARAPRPFNHALHGTKAELECASCHRTATKAAEAGMPKIKQCVLCHEGIDENKPKERTLAVLFGDAPVWSTVTKLPEEIIFSHQAHLAKEVKCAECHQGIESNEHVTEALRVGMDACLACHEKKGQAGDCALCHKETRADKPPESHRMNWKKSHAAVARLESRKPYENRCALCHTEASCESCHRDQPPANHTDFWRMKGHSVAAGADRSTCATCHHRTDFCDRCHRETPPRTHTASWGGSRASHCLSCHEPRSSERTCVMCHGAQRHASAPARPANAQHAGATDALCRNCHGIIGLPHVDNGDRCGACH